MSSPAHESDSPQSPSAQPRKTREGVKDDLVFKMPARKKVTKSKAAAITDTNDLWQMIQSPKASVQALVMRWVNLYGQDSDDALLQLVNMIIHATGCPGSLNKEQFEDQESVADWLEELQTHFDPVSHHDYPLFVPGKQYSTSTGQPIKRTVKTRIRDTFLDFFTRLIVAVRDDTLFNEQFTDVLFSWIITMSSSTFRPFRHTATMIALYIMTQLAEACADLQVEQTQTTKQLSTATRSRSGESTKSRTTDRVKQLTIRETQLQQHKAIIEEMMKTLFDSVFVHRYRDIDPLIRRDCIVALSLWVTKLPETFLDATYVRYLGWMLSDSSPIVRHDLLFSLCSLYEDNRYANELRAFTERFKPRILEIALEEVDMDVQIVAIRLCSLIIKSGTFDNDERLQLCTLAFHASVAVRSAVGVLVAEVFSEDFLEDALVPLQTNAKPMSDQDELSSDSIAFKTLARFIQQLVRVHLVLENKQRHPPSQHPTLEFTSTNDNASNGGNVTPVTADISALVATFVDATASHIKAYQRWQGLGDYLCMDLSELLEQTSHDAMNEEGESTIEWSLETVLLHLFQTLLEHIHGSLRTRLSDNVQGVTGPSGATKPLRKGRSSEGSNGLIIAPLDASRYVVSASIVQRLLLKHATDKERVCCILRLAQFCDSNQWIEMRMVSAYETLLENIARIFFMHTSIEVLAECCKTWARFTQSDLLSSTTTARLIEIQERTIREAESSLQSLFQGSIFNTEVLTRAEADLLRVQQLMKQHSLLSILEDGNFISLLKSVGEKLQVSKGTEGAMVTTLDIVFLYFMWTFTAFMEADSQPDTAPDAVEQLMLTRDWIIDSCTWLLLNGGSLDRHHKRAVFSVVSELYILLNGRFTDKHRVQIDKLLCPIAVEDQIKLAKYIEQDILKNAEQDLGQPYAVTVAEIELIRELTQWAKLVITGLLDYKYVATLLAGYGNYGTHYDAVVRYVLQASHSIILADESYRQVAPEVYLTAIKRCFEAYLHHVSTTDNDEVQPHAYVRRSPDSVLQLARLCHSTLRNIEQIDYAVVVSYGSVWMIEKLGEYRSNAEKRSRLSIFSRPLKEFVSGLDMMQARETLQTVITAMQENHVELVSTGKDMEALMHALAKKAGIKLEQLPIKRAVKTKISGTRRSLTKSTVKSDDAEYGRGTLLPDNLLKRHRPSRTTKSTEKLKSKEVKNDGDVNDEIESSQESEEEEVNESSDDVKTTDKKIVNSKRQRQEKSHMSNIIIPVSDRSSVLFPSRVKRTKGGQQFNNSTGRSSPLLEVIVPSSTTMRQQPSPDDIESFSEEEETTTTPIAPALAHNRTSARIEPVVTAKVYGRTSTPGSRGKRRTEGVRREEEVDDIVNASPSDSPLRISVEATSMFASSPRVKRRRF